MAKYTYNDKYFEIIDSDDKAYWLGFLYADGCIHEINDKSKSKHAIKPMMLELSLQEKDKYHLEKFARDIKTDARIFKKETKINDKVYYSYKINIYNTKICRDLIKLGCTQRKSLTLTFPKSELLNGYESAFIRGYFDGDGCIHYSERNYVDKRNNKSYTQKNLCVSIVGTNEFLSSLKNIVHPYDIYFNFVKRANVGNAFEIKMCKKQDIKRFYEYIYSNASVFMDRKYNKFIYAFEHYEDLKIAS